MLAVLVTACDLINFDIFNATFLLSCCKFTNKEPKYWPYLLSINYM